MDRKLGGVAVAILLACGTAHAQAVVDEIDRFTGQRKLDYTSSGKIEFGVPKVAIFAQSGGKAPVNGIRFLISPKPTGRYSIQPPAYIGCRRVDWLVDGRPLELGMVVHNTQRFDRLLVEFVTQGVTAEQLAQIGAAQSVEYRICGVEGRLGPADIAAARDIAGRLGQDTAPNPGLGPTSPPPPAPPAMKYRPKF